MTQLFSQGAESVRNKSWGLEKNGGRNTMIYT